MCASARVCVCVLAKNEMKVIYARKEEQATLSSIEDFYFFTSLFFGFVLNKPLPLVSRKCKANT